MDDLIKNIKSKLSVDNLVEMMKEGIPTHFSLILA